jgi:hypothetical protein
MALVNQSVFASCNVRDIKEQANGSFTYPLDCHKEFGKLRKDEEARKRQVEHLKESIKLKDLAIDYSNTRIKTWQDATYKVEDRLIKLDKNNSRAKWIWYGLGILTMSAAVYGAGKLK